MNVVDFFRSVSKPVLLAAAALGVGVIAVYTFFIHEEDEPADEQVMPWEAAENEEPAYEHESEPDVSEYIIDIKGAVMRPGIYQVDDGDRVYDAVQLAGGLSEEADDRAVNLAERCYDEMVIYIPVVDEQQAGVPVPPVSAHETAEDAVLINDATADELTALPGIGPSKADAIFSYREENGPFKTADDLLNVSGIGEKTVEAISDFIIIQ